MHPVSRRFVAVFVRTLTFGVEDSLVSTVGLLSGVAAAGSGQKAILLTGLVLIFVESFSMAIGALLSEHAAEEYLARHETSLREPMVVAGVMFVSYFLSGFVPLAPYVIFESTLAFPLSIAVSLLALFLVGAVSAKKFGLPPWRKGVEMLLIGGLAVLIGVGVGSLF